MNNMQIMDREFVTDFVTNLIGQRVVCTPYTFSQGAQIQPTFKNFTFLQGNFVPASTHVPLRSFGTVITMSSGTLNLDFTNAPDSAYFQQYYGYTTRTLSFNSANDFSLSQNNGTRSPNTFFIPLGSVVTGNGVFTNAYQGPITLMYNLSNCLHIFYRTEDLYYGGFQCNNGNALWVSGPNCFFYSIPSGNAPVNLLVDSFLNRSTSISDIAFTGWRIIKEIQSRFKPTYYYLNLA